MKTPDELFELMKEYKYFNEAYLIVELYDNGWLIQKSTCIARNEI